MQYDPNVLQAIAHINAILASRDRNLWEDDIRVLEEALSVLDRIRGKR